MRNCSRYESYKLFRNFISSERFPASDHKLLGIILRYFYKAQNLEHKNKLVHEDLLFVI